MADGIQNARDKLLVNRVIAVSEELRQFGYGVAAESDIFRIIAAVLLVIGNDLVQAVRDVSRDS